MGPPTRESFVPHALSRVAACCLLFAACKAPPPPPAPASEPVPVVRFAGSDGSFVGNSGYATATNIVIADSTGWAAAWATLHSGVQPQPPIVNVDFAREMVLLVAIGQQPNLGHGVRITGAERTDSGIVVHALHHKAHPTCGTGQALTEPADIARMAKTDLAVRFVVADTVGAPCS